MKGSSPRGTHLRHHVTFAQGSTYKGIDNAPTISSYERQILYPDSADLTSELWAILNDIVHAGRVRRTGIADAYDEAQEMMAVICLYEPAARFMACLERSKALKAEGNVKAVGWMLAALRERIADRDIADWKNLIVIVDRAAQFLRPERLLH